MYTLMRASRDTRGVFPAAGNDHSAVNLTISELEDASGAAGWVDVCKEPEK